MRLVRSLFTAAAFAAAALPLCATAQVESTPIPAVQKPDFSSASFLVGTWTCSTKSARRPAPYVTISKYTLDPSGYWIDETSTTKKTSWVASPITVVDKITYDSDSKRWVDVLYGDQGAYGMSVSKGWNGNHITWHDLGFAPSPDISSASDIATTKVSATKMTSASTFTETKSGRHVSVSTVCTKA